VTSWDNNLYLVEGHYYILKVELYDKDKNAITLTENLIIKNLIDLEYFEIVKTRKASELLIRAKKTTPKNQKSSIAFVLDQVKS